jgi:hypothetical protein
MNPTSFGLATPEVEAGGWRLEAGAGQADRSSTSPSNGILIPRCLPLKTGIVVDATLIAVPTSTNNQYNGRFILNTEPQPY